MRIAGLVQRECLFGSSGVVHRLSERELEMESIFLAQVGQVERATHGRDIGFVELDGLQIGQAEPGFAEVGIETDGLAIRFDPFGLPSNRFQDVAVAHPHSRLLGGAGQDSLVQFDRFVEVAQSGNGRGLQIEMAQILAIVLEQFLKQGQGLGRTAHTAQNERKLRASGSETRGDLEGSAQEMLGILLSTDSPRQFGQHPDRLRVVGIFLEVRFQQPFCDIQSVFMQRKRSLQEPRMPVMCPLGCHRTPLARHSGPRQATDKRFDLGLSSVAQTDDEAPMKYFEDMQVGSETVFGHYDVTREEVLEFARKYDPQPFHLSDEAAAKTHFGRLAASGWHTCAMTMAVIVRHLSEDRQAGLGSPGVDDLRWLKPVYPGDRLTVSGKILETTPSRSKPEIGSIRTETIVTNQDGVRVMRFISIVLMLRRPSAA